MLEFAFVTYFIEKYSRQAIVYLYIFSSILITYANEMTQQSNSAKEKGVDITIRSEQNYKLKQRFQAQKKSTRKWKKKQKRGINHHVIVTWRFLSLCSCADDINPKWGKGSPKGLASTDYWILNLQPYCNILGPHLVATESGPSSSESGTITVMKGHGGASEPVDPARSNGASDPPFRA